jgi:hypothetical protein
MKGATPNTQITLVKEDKKVIKQPKMIGPYVSLKNMIRILVNWRSSGKGSLWESI